MRDVHQFLVVSPRTFNEKTSLVIGLPMTTAEYNSDNPFAVGVGKTAGRKAVLGESEMDAQQFGAEVTRFFGRGLKQQQEQVARFAVRRQCVHAGENALARLVVVPGQLEVVVHHVGRMVNIFQCKPQGAAIIRRRRLRLRAGHGQALRCRGYLIGGDLLPPRLSNSYARDYLGHGQAFPFQSLDFFYPAYRVLGKIPHHVCITFFGLGLLEDWLRQ